MYLRMFIFSPSNAFTLREDKTGQVFISGTTEILVMDSEDALKFNKVKLVAYILDLKIGKQL